MWPLGPTSLGTRSEISSPNLRSPMTLVGLLVNNGRRFWPNSIRDRGPDPVVPQAWGEPEALVRLDGVHPLVLEVVGLHLVEERDPSTLLLHVDDHPSPSMATRSMGSWCWSPQSRRRECSTSPVGHAECTRTSASSFPSGLPMRSARWVSSSISFS